LYAYEAVVEPMVSPVYEIEESPRTLHRDRGYSDRCLRLREGLAFTRPEDCDCGLDALLAEAHAFTADRDAGARIKG
jgi:hypothetical protein